ncbi:hypothetical protein E9993_13720 [Labilibacter sediminis]|nr:hypothetical protein E9993_13720 [Labilibacter sediminis]
MKSITSVIPTRLKFIRPSLFVFVMLIAFGIMITYKYGYVKGVGIGREKPVASKGYLNITEQDLQEHKLLALRGEFAFYWNQLYTPRYFNTDTIELAKEYAYVPSVWNNQSYYGDEVSALGYATYHLVIHVPYDALYGIKVKELDCAYHLMVNGESVKVGTVGTNKETTIPSWKREELFFYSKNKKIDLVLQIANFHHRKGGPEDVMLFGETRNIVQYKEQQGIMSVFLFGVLFMLAVYFLLIYIVGRREPSVIWFSTFCFFALLRLLTTGEKVLLEILPSLNWDIAVRIEYLSFIIPTALAFSFLRTFYTSIFKKWFEIAVWSIAVVSALMVLITPPTIFSYIPVYYQIFILIIGAYMLLGIVVALIKRYEFAVVFLIGIIFFYATLVNDVLYFNKIISAGYLMPYGLFILFFSFSFVMSKHLTNAFLDADRLRVALKKHTIHLEKEVMLRTEEIRQQKDSIQQQAFNLEEANNKLLNLNRFRDEMTGMIVHDLKNPLNSIINLAQMKDVPEKDNLIWQAGIEMHNMVLNILDVNKADEVGFTINKGMVNFQDLVSEAIYDVNVNASKRAISIIRHEDFNFIVLGDRVVLKRVLVNLLINAIRFSPSNGKVTISFRKQPDNTFVCIIKDQGPGIRRDQQEIIFDRYRSSELSDKSLRSTGLGLTFCKMAVEAHSGSVYINSVIGEGSEFCVKLPVESSLPSSSHKVISTNKDAIDIMNLKDECKLKIKPFIQELKKLEVFEVSDINNVLGEIKDEAIVDGDLIVANIKEAVLSCNQDKYDSVINVLMDCDV